MDEMERLRKENAMLRAIIVELTKSMRNAIEMIEAAIEDQDRDRKI